MILQTLLIIKEIDSRNSFDRLPQSLNFIPVIRFIWFSSSTSEYFSSSCSLKNFLESPYTVQWQTLLIIKEIEKIMKCPPTRIFVEMTRKDDEKGDNGRKSSRKDQLTYQAPFE